MSGGLVKTEGDTFKAVYLALGEKWVISLVGVVVHACDAFCCRFLVDEGYTCPRLG